MVYMPICVPSVDCTRAGDGEVGVDITHKGRKVPVTITQSTKGMYRVTYSPYEAGAYSINVHFNRAEVRGKCDMW